MGYVFTHLRLTDSLEGVLPRHLNRFDQLFLNQLPYCMLFRRSAWQAAGGYDETMHDGSEDWEFTIRLSQAGFRGVELAKPLFVYAVRPDGMLLSRATRMHGTIWRHIRSRHAGLYRIGALTRLWRQTREQPSKVSAGTATALLLAAKLLPEDWFNALFFWLLVKTRSRRIDRGEIKAAGADGVAQRPEAR